MVGAKEIKPEGEGLVAHRAPTVVERGERERIILLHDAGYAVHGLRAEKLYADAAQRLAACHGFEHGALLAVAHYTDA